MPTEDALLKCLEMEWQDHFQTRQQTWRTLEIEAALAVALVGIDWKLNNTVATVAAALLLVLAAMFGFLITFRHRKVERRKFEHIMAIETVLGVGKPGGIFWDEKAPEAVKLVHVLNPLKSNIPLFIMRMHAILMAFGIIYLAARLGQR